MGRETFVGWLRDRRFSSYRFCRQHPFGPHILDFFCREAWVDIELDGFQHGTREQQAKDVERDAFLEARGIKVLRFWTPACGARKMPSATRFGGRCRSALRIHRRITAGQCRLALTTRGASQVEPALFVRLARFRASRSPSPCPLPRGEGTLHPALGRAEALRIGESVAQVSPSPKCISQSELRPLWISRTLPPAP